MPYTLLPDDAPASGPARRSGYVLLPDDTPADRIPGQVSRPAEPDAPNTLLDKIKGAYLEAPAAILSGLVGTGAGQLAGLATHAFNPSTYGTQQGVRNADELAARVADKLTYHPTTQTGQDITQAVGKVMGEAVPLAGLGGEAAALSRAGAPVARAVTDTAREVPGIASQAAQSLAETQRLLRAKITQAAPGGAKPPMAGVGAAKTDEALQRAVRAQQMDPPLNLTRGMATRDQGWQGFEAETAKNPELGGPLRERATELNRGMAAVLDNFDTATGATPGQTLRGVGESVDTALRKKLESAKLDINESYNRARAAGHMEDPVPYDGLSTYLKAHETEATTGGASMLKAVQERIAAHDPEGTGMLPIKDMEDLRKMAGRLTEPGSVNSAYVGDIKGLIDSATEGRGGMLYKEARRKYENYAKQFKDRQVVSKLVRTKPGTTDRAVALEDVFNHSILNSSLDDVRHLRRVLQAGGGPEGAQAWNDLRGQTVRHIKDQMLSNVARDTHGEPIPSPSKVSKAIQALDADGKLEFIFGKQGADKLRDISEISRDIYTTVPGANNTSNSASVILAAIDAAASFGVGLPIPITSGIKWGLDRRKTQAARARVGEALAPQVPGP